MDSSPVLPWTWWSGSVPGGWVGEKDTFHLPGQLGLPPGPPPPQGPIWCPTWSRGFSLPWSLTESQTLQDPGCSPPPVGNRLIFSFLLYACPGACMEGSVQGAGLTWAAWNEPATFSCLFILCYFGIEAGIWVLTSQWPACQGG